MKTSLSHFVFVVFVASTTIAVADEVRPAAKDVPSKPLFAFEPLGRDKDRIPDGKATLAVVDGKLTAFATGFTLIAEAIPMPADGKVFFELQGVADKSLAIVSVNDREVWTYDGDKKNLVSSPPVEVKPKDNDPKKFKLQVTVGKGPFALGGIQTFVVREATMSRETAKYISRPSGRQNHTAVPWTRDVPKPAWAKTAAHTRWRAFPGGLAKPSGNSCGSTIRSASREQLSQRSS